jgi:hypothetical protein
MIKDFEQYHGAVFTRLLHSAEQPLSIKPYPSDSNASYVLNEKIGLYIKHSMKRMSPWSFTFQKSHQDEILEMKNKFQEVFVVFVCYTDGIVCLSFQELKAVLNDRHEQVEWVRIKRRRREKYAISGTDGSLRFKIGENEFPRKLFESG